VEYNRKADDHALEEIRILIPNLKHESGQEIVAVILEPIMSEGGDLPVSAYFANGIRELTNELGIFMIVDEVQTGVGATGTYWAHEQ